MTIDQDRDRAEDLEEFSRTFMAEQQKLADAAGMDVFTYMAQAHGGILKETIAKLTRHEQAHPKECPADCAFQTSLKRLKEEYGQR